MKKEWEKHGNPKTRGVTGDMYSFMITKYTVPAVTKIYGQRAVWQNDQATTQKLLWRLDQLLPHGSNIRSRHLR